MNFSSEAVMSPWYYRILLSDKLSTRVVYNTIISSGMDNTPQVDKSLKAVVLITLAYAPVIGGAERQGQEILERLAKNGREVWVLTRRVPGAPVAEQLNGVQVFRLWNLWWPVLSWLSFCGAVLCFLAPRRHRVGVVWSVMLNVAAFASVLAGHWLGFPALVRISASGVGGNLRVMQKSFWGAWLARYTLSGSRSIITLNSETDQEVTSFGIPSMKLTRIPNGVDTAYFQPALEEERKKLRSQQGWKENQPITLLVGRLDEQKNVRNLLDVWPTLAQRFPAGQLVLVGEGPLQHALRVQIQTLGLQNSVRMLTVRKEIRSLYQACDVFILPSFYEGMSNALLEAMACGLPALVSRIPGNIELVDEGKNGFLVDPNHPAEWVGSWERLLRESDLRRKMGEEARRKVISQFSMDAVMRQWSAFF
jgi:glycosyltransferase involved in cell wall biosynthesis